MCVSQNIVIFRYATGKGGNLEIGWTKSLNTEQHHDIGNIRQEDGRLPLELAFLREWCGNVFH